MMRKRQFALKYALWSLLAVILVAFGIGLSKTTILIISDISEWQERRRFGHKKSATLRSSNTTTNVNSAKEQEVKNIPKVVVVNDTSIDSSTTINTSKPNDAIDTPISATSVEIVINDGGGSNFKDRSKALSQKTVATSISKESNVMDQSDALIKTTVPPSTSKESNVMDQSDALRKTTVPPSTFKETNMMDQSDALGEKTVAPSTSVMDRPDALRKTTVAPSTSNNSNDNDQSDALGEKTVATSTSVMDRPDALRKTTVAPSTSKNSNDNDQSKALRKTTVPPSTSKESNLIDQSDTLRQTTVNPPTSKEANVIDGSKATRATTLPPSTSKESSTNEIIKAPTVSSHKLSIPHNLWFAHENDLLEIMTGKDYDNVQRIVNSFRRFWGNEEAPVRFLNDDTCKELISEAGKDLLPSFELSELDSSIKNDICRLSALYLHGGYYFDTAIDAVGKISMKRRTTFVITEACEGSCFFQGFIASSPKHPILRDTLKMILDEHLSGDTSTPLNAANAMYKAYTNLSDQEKGGIRLLEQIILDYRHEYGYENKEYPSIQRRYGTGQCNVVIHDPKTKIIYFFKHYMGSSKCKEGLIPHELWFNDKENILETRSHEGIYNNVMNTIEKYRSFWDEPEAPVHFLDDGECREAIRVVIPELLPHFDNEIKGPYRGDMCRNAAIYNDGGYYFDVDIEVVNVIEPEPTTTFISTMACEGRCIFQAFFSCSPKHPIIWNSLERMLQIYETKEDNKLIGPVTMLKAYRQYPDREHYVELFEEGKLDVGENPILYPSVPRQPATGSCNYIVHDPEKEVVYFFSRFFGFKSCIAPKPEKEES